MIRIFDIIFSLIGLIVLSPIIIITALLIKLEDNGPILFKQIRIGKNLKEFTMYKFRSMRFEKDRFVGKLSDDEFNKMSVEEKLKLRNSFTTKNSIDDRITNIGKFIRKTSIDEIPQLYNVFIGDMSIVGPRPDTPIQILDYSIDNWRKRHTIKPGITGLAQINGRSEIKKEMRIKLDLEYVEKKSILLYLKIIFLTALNLLDSKSN